MSILFYHYLHSNEIIKFYPDNQIEEIKTKYGIILYEKLLDFELDIDRSSCVKYYIRISNLKNLGSVNFTEIRKKYEKYKVSLFLEQLEKVK